MSNPMWVRTNESQWEEYYLHMSCGEKFLRKTHDGQWWMCWARALYADQWEPIPNATTLDEASAYALAIWRME